MSHALLKQRNTSSNDVSHVSLKDTTQQQSSELRRIFSYTSRKPQNKVRPLMTRPYPPPLLMVWPLVEELFLRRTLEKNNNENLDKKIEIEYRDSYDFYQH